MTRHACLAGLIGLLPLDALAQSVATPAQPTQPAPPVVQSEPEIPAMVQISGVETLVDYAAVSRMLSAVDGVRRVDVAEADGATITFRVLVRGGSAALDRVLDGSSQLVRSGPASGRLVYEYRR